MCWQFCVLEVLVSLKYNHHLLAIHTWFPLAAWPLLNWRIHFHLPVHSFYEIIGRVSNVSGQWEVLMTRQVEPGNSSAASSGLMVGRGKKRRRQKDWRKSEETGPRPSPQKKHGTSFSGSWTSCKTFNLEHLGSLMQNDKLFCRWKQ